jgi:glycosyltransferase involved in cell wall biosynthesis
VNTPNSTVSLLVPTYNRLHALDRIWESWLAQPEIREIVLVDDGSTQDYAPFVAKLEAAALPTGVRVSYVRNTTRRGAPAARNVGIAECTGGFVLTTDDDIQLAPGMVGQLLEFAARNSGPAIVGARVIYPKDGEPHTAAKSRSDADTGAYYRLPELLLTPWLNPNVNLRAPTVTAVALWPRKLFDQGLRWHEGYGGNGYREETDPQLVAQAVFGAEVWYVPAAECYHLPPAQAYIGASGQRRGGLLWFEYWVQRNNLLFWWRHGAYLSKHWGASRLRGVASLALTRVNPRRIVSMLAARRRAAALRVAASA